jgi:hypothetical protein
LLFLYSQEIITGKSSRQPRENGTVTRELHK